MIKRQFFGSMIVVGLAFSAGCGSSTALPGIPAVDNRPAEVKEADDAMLKQNALVNKGVKK